jgi:hypothetical protein
MKRVIDALDVSDVLVILGLGVLARGLWLVAPWLAYVAVGAVMVWYALPARPPFIDRATKTRD